MMADDLFTAEGILGSPIDDIFSYQTVKVVRIQDRWLGLWDILCKLAVFLVFLLYFIIWKRGYVEWENATGTVSMRILGGVRGVNASTLPYCANNNCRLIDRYSVATWDSKSIFIDTYVEEVEQKRQCRAEDPVCPFESAFEDFGSTDYFTAGIEDMILEIRHDVQASTFYSRSFSNKFKGSSTTMQGSLLSYREDAHGRGTLQEIRTVGNGSIKISIGEIISAAGLNLDSPATSDAVDTLRRTGGTLAARIRYSNAAPWLGLSPSSTIYFTLQFSLVEYAASRTFAPMGFGDERMLVKRSGVRLNVIQDGILCAFSLLALLQTLAGGYLLLRVVVSFNDWLAGKILPLDHFETAKYEYTENMQAVRQAIRAQEEYKVLSDAGTYEALRTSPPREAGSILRSTASSPSRRRRSDSGNELPHFGSSSQGPASPLASDRGRGNRVQLPPPPYSFEGRG